MKLPHDPDAELAVLGSLLLTPNPADALEAYQTDPSAFYVEAHRLIFGACKSLHDERVDVDEVTVCARLEAEGNIAKAGNRSGIAKIIDSTPTAVNLPHYTRIVRDLWRRRVVYNAAQTAIAAVLDENKPTDEALDAANRAIVGAQMQQAVTRAESMKTIVAEKFKQLEAQHKGEAGEPGVPSGFSDLDAMTGGFRKGNLILLGGRPSMGKSAFAFQCAAHQAVAEGKRVLFFSPEMVKDELADRAISSRGRIDLQKLRRPKLLRDTDWPRLANALGYLSTEGLLIDDEASTLAEVRTAARLAMLEGGIDIVWIDYLQLLRPGKDRDSREREVSELSRGAKALAKELRVPVVALSQLNRKVEDRTGEDRRPRLSDLRESGSLEQDGDLIMFAHRPAYYDPEADAGVSEIIVAKQRNGPTGIVELAWEAEFASFRNLARRGEDHAA